MVQRHISVSVTLHWRWHDVAQTAGTRIYFLTEILVCLWNFDCWITLSSYSFSPLFLLVTLAFRFGKGDKWLEVMRVWTLPKKKKKILIQMIWKVHVYCMLWSCSTCTSHLDAELSQRWFGVEIAMCVCTVVDKTRYHFYLRLAYRRF